MLLLIFLVIVCGVGVVFVGVNVFGCVMFSENFLFKFVLLYVSKI